MTFVATPIRTNGDKPDYDWFNALRAAGVLMESFLGAGYITETSFPIANNQATANVTGLVFAAASYKSAIVFCEIRRKTDTGGSEVVAVGKASLFYRAESSAWDLVTDLPGDETGVTLSITAGGQVQYASTNIAGANYVGTMKFKAMSFTA